MSCGNIANNDRQSNTKSDNSSDKKIISIPIETKDSLPFNKFWKVVKDTLKYSQINKNEKFVLDTTTNFKIVKGHFTSKDCLNPL